MNRALRACGLFALLLGGCWVYAEGGYYYGGCGDCWDDCYCSYMYDGWDPADVVADDFDGDGRIDLAVSDGSAEAVWLVLARDFGFPVAPDRRLPTRGVPAVVAPFDALGDGGAGLLVLGGGTGGPEAFTADAAGDLVALPSPSTPETLATATRLVRARVDGDEIDDVVYVDASGGVHVALGTGAGAFVEVDGDPAAGFLGPEAASRVGGIHVVVAGFDGERGADLLVVDGQVSTLAVFSGRGDGTFGETRTAAFSSRGDVLSVAAVQLERGDRAMLALLFGDAGNLSARSTLTVVDPEDGALVVDDDAYVGSARSMTAVDLDGDGRTDLLLSDPAVRTIRPLYLHKD